jgi:hypothetical protein
MSSRRALASDGATNARGWARRFFENWQASLKWQRLKPYEKFAEMIDVVGMASPPPAG